MFILINPPHAPYATDHIECILLFVYSIEWAVTMYLDFWFLFYIMLFQTLLFAWFHQNEMHRIETFFLKKKKLLRVRSAFFILQDQQEQERESETFKYLFIESKIFLLLLRFCCGYCSYWTVMTEAIVSACGTSSFSPLLHLNAKTTSNEMNLTIFNHVKWSHKVKWSLNEMHWTLNTSEAYVQLPSHVILYMQKFIFVSLFFIEMVVWHAFSSQGENEERDEKNKKKTSNQKRSHRPAIRYCAAVEQQISMAIGATELQLKHHHYK